MTKLSDLQCILLSTASQRTDGNIHPFPASVDPRGGVKAVGALLRRGLVEERWPCRAEGAVPALHINAAGLHAIGIESETEGEAEANAPEPRPSHSGSFTKAGALLNLLGRDEGAVMTELIEATGWLPHTVRAALTGLRKKGHAIDRTTRDGKSCYCIRPAV